MNRFVQSNTRVKITLYIAAAILLFLLVTGLIVADYLRNKEPYNSVNQMAQSVIVACEEAEYRPTCYEKEVPRLLVQNEMETVFDVVRQIQESDTSYQFCHVLAHEIGEQETAKDPERWIDVITQCPQDGLCSNGCMHGAAVERFSAEVLSDELVAEAVPDLQIACEPRDGWNPTALDKAICYHGLGHMTVHITGADLVRSLELCSVITDGDSGHERLCDEGVFMQIFQPLEPEDHALIDRLEQIPTQENLEEFCGRYGDKVEQAACWREGWPIFNERIHTPEGIVGHCTDGPAYNDEELCYGTVLTINARHTLSDSGTMVTLCNSLPRSRQDSCFSIGATTILEENRTHFDRSVQFCAEAKNDNTKTVCYRHLSGYVSFVYDPDAPETIEQCSHLPDLHAAECRRGL